MSIRQTAVSYYGLNYVEHAERDFQEMVEHGCTTVILAVTEFDFDFWRPSIPAIVECARRQGLRVLIDPWGNGKYFGGEQVSKFLQDNVENRQVSALTGERLPYACFNTNSYRDYFRTFCLTLASEAKPDGFFWDEPHYAFPKGIASITGGVADDWTCHCPVCRKRFEDYYGYPMPRYMTNDVKSFRWREALVVLSDTSKALKELNPHLEITCCVHATQNGYYVSEYRGYDNWDMVASCPYFDVFSTTIINWALPEEFFRDITRRTVEVAHRHGKLAERWFMGYYRQPADWAQVGRWMDIADEMGVDRIAAWTYRGGYGTVVAAPDALRLWDTIGENYRRLLGRAQS